MSYPERRWLTHHRPSWVNSSDPLFITLCAQPRGQNHFANPTRWTKIIQVTEHLEVRHYCQPLLLLAMPDHLHLLCRIPRKIGIQTYLRLFKHAVSYQNKVPWQRGGFEHRLRNQDQVAAKFDYIIKNPIRANLTPIPWPYQKIWPINREADETTDAM